MNAASPVRAMTPSSTAKKQFLRKGEGKSFRSSSKAYRETVSDEAISSQERLKLLEKMQQDHLQKLEQKMQQSVKRIIFVVGGAFGFSEAMYERANQQLSLSKMTFSHQMIRLFFVEQLYRAMTITRGEPYHNE